VKEVRIKIRNSDDEVNNTEKKCNKKFSILVKVMELFLRHPIPALAYKWSSDMVSPGTGL
jgi:hypothetical protein